MKALLDARAMLAVVLEQPRIGLSEGDIEMLGGFQRHPALWNERIGQG